MANSLRVPIRQQEFIRSRWLCRYLMKTDQTIGRGVHGNPLWPADWNGSITHKYGHVAVTVIPQSQNLSPGIDLEGGDRVGEHLAAKICNQAELELINRVSSKFNNQSLLSSSTPFSSLLGVVFSIKEALFKSHFPLGKKFFYFHDAQIDSLQLDGPQGTANGRVLIDTSPLTPSNTPFTANFSCLTMDEKAYFLSAVSTPMPPAFHQKP